MTRNQFREQLDGLNQELRAMGVLVQQAISGAVKALVAQNVEAARSVIAGDKAINQAYLQIEQHCLELVALQQPMATDLRQIAATLKGITDLERMADHAVDIARVVVRLGGQPLVKPLIDIPEMATLTQTMVEDALIAFVGRDKERALAMIALDHQVDRLHKKVIGDLQVLMEQHTETVGQCIQLLFVSGALERIGDHATNLGEWLLYLQTGERADLNQ